MFRLPVWIVAGVVSLALLNVQRASASPPSKSDPPAPMVRLPGHVLPALAKAKAVPSQSKSVVGESLTLTLVLKRDDQAGFERYLHDVYDPKSPNYRHFLTQSELSDRFGPSRAAYDGVLDYLQENGFTLVEGSANRLTLTVRGTRSQAERTFAVHIGDYKIGDKRFHANDVDPGLPGDLAQRVAGVSGLSNFATPHRSLDKVALLCDAIAVGRLVAWTFNPFTLTVPGAGIAAICTLTRLFLIDWEALNHVPGTPYKDPFGPWNPFGPDFLKFGKFGATKALARQSKALQSPVLDGTGQTVGLLEFDAFQKSDVSDFLALMGFSSSQINNLSEVPVNGGAPVGPNQNEVLIDIDVVMSVSPGAKVVVYNAPFNGQATSYQALLNAMINGGVTVISNSWSSCEDQLALADVQSIDSVLQSAAASGISVFNAAGDSGSTCLDGSANTIGVPADSPHATAVGGSSLTIGPGASYGSETWWNGTNATPPTGQGGVGVSKFFSRPTYQNGLNASSMRSVPDVVVNADPAKGIPICQASAGGCPTGLLYGGTSMSAPVWAAFAALLNQSQGQDLGAFNPLIYPFANTQAFHNAASMSSDFAHVGLGSPNLNVLHLLLSGQAAGLPDADSSQVVPLAPVRHRQELNYRFRCEV